MITKQDVQEKKNNLNIATQELNKILQAYAEQECPFKAGDVVDNCGYDRRFREVLVVSIQVPRYKPCGDWLVLGHGIKKDGTAGLQKVSFTQLDFNLKNGK